MSDKNILLTMKDISKSFPGVQALKCANLTAYYGRVMALLGENGAGKSTLMKILSGVYAADSGEIFFDGNNVSFKNTHQSAEAGIAIIHQELNIIPNLTVSENLFLGREIVTSYGKIDKKRTRQEAIQLLQRVNLDIDPDTPVKNLSVGVQQMLEIARACSQDAKLFIMDEPTASLMDKDVERLFELILQLKNQNKSIIYISHRMKEIFEICDDVTIFRDGQWIAEREISETNEQQLIEDIVGRKMQEQYPYVKGVRGNEVLAFKNLCGRQIKNSSGAFYAGEVIGLSGLVGSGRTEIARALFGAYPIDSGEIFLEGKKVGISSPKDALSYGIAYLSEDRKGDGLILGMSVAKNTTISVLKSLQGILWHLKQDEEDKLVNSYSSKLKIKTPSLEQFVKNLSGGNQQKVAFARALTVKPKILFLDEPTRGIDVGAKKEIYDLINELKKEGIAIVMISSDMSEILGMSDYVMVFSEGKITGYLSREDASSEKVMRYAIGMENNYDAEKVYK